MQRTKLGEIVDKCTLLLSKHEDVLSDGENRNAEESVRGKMIPTPKILVKDHKKQKPDGKFPTRLVVPASNFNACFPKLGYMGIKKLLDDYGIKYGKRNIIQLLDIKNNWKHWT